MHFYITCIIRLAIWSEFTYVHWFHLHYQRNIQKICEMQLPTTQLVDPVLLKRYSIGAPKTS
jgi:hypothetical protein